MYIILLIIVCIYFYGKISKLESEIKSLKGLTKTSEPTVATTAQPEAGSFAARLATSESGEMIGDIRVPVAQTPYVSEEVNLGIIDWLKKDFMVKLGAFLLLIALGWFVSYAFANNWIGPVGRIVIGLLLGGGFIVGGTLRAPKSQSQGGIFVVLGSAIVLLTVFAAREMYDLFTPVTALLVMFMSVVFVAKFAVSYRMISVAVAGLALAAIAPFLTASPTADVVMLFSYLTVIIVGILWVLSLMKANVLLLLALSVTALYSAPYMFTHGSDAAVALGFGFFFTLLFFFSNLYIFVRWPYGASAMNYFVAIGTGFYLFLWILDTNAFDDSWKSLVYLAWALVFAYGSFIVFRILENKVPFYLYGSVSLGLLAAATATIFEGEVLAIVYTIQITALVVLASRVLGSYGVASRLSWLYIAPILLTVGSLDPYAWRSGDIFHSDSLVVINLILCLSVAAYTLHAGKVEANEGESINTASILTVFAGLYAIAWVWLAAHAALPFEQGTMAALVIYLITGLTLYIEGRSVGSRGMRIAGTVLIAIVVGRLLLVEVWAMSVTGRIIIFTIVGVALISTAFIKKLNNSHDD
jgi:uncharacterized membrane protein